MGWIRADGQLWFGVLIAIVLALATVRCWFLSRRWHTVALVPIDAPVPVPVDVDVSVDQTQPDGDSGVSPWALELRSLRRTETLALPQPVELRLAEEIIPRRNDAQGSEVEPHYNEELGFLGRTRTVVVFAPDRRLVDFTAEVAARLGLEMPRIVPMRTPFGRRHHRSHPRIRTVNTESAPYTLSALILTVLPWVLVAVLSIGALATLIGLGDPGLDRGIEG